MAIDTAVPAVSRAVSSGPNIMSCLDDLESGMRRLEELEQNQWSALSMLGIQRPPSDPSPDAPGGPEMGTLDRMAAVASRMNRLSSTLEEANKVLHQYAGN